ncbi:MAG: hypothetical protein ACOY3H_06770 [Bacillota bacterium]
MLARIVEAYIGEYASGKSENAVNRALELAALGRQVTLVDLDLVEPFYTLRPIKHELKEQQVDVIAWDTAETMGLGEAGSVIKPEMRWALWRPGDIILDIGYGVEGAKTLNLVEGARESEELQVLAVINASRPMTAAVADIVQHVREMGIVHGLINNTHLGDETTLEVIVEGLRLVAEAAEILGMPIVATSVDEKFRSAFPEGRDPLGNPVRFLRRLMPKAMW